jgi:large repetitive protein
VNGDALDEVDETFTLSLSNHPNAALGDVIGLGTITDDDPLPALSIANATVTEGNSGTVNATFTVSLTPVSGRSVTVSYATANGTASAADYSATTGTLTFAAGETTKTIPVAVNGDLLNEDNETFSVTLSAPTNATLADADAVGTITDDDGTPSFSIADVTSAEGQSGGVNASFEVTLNSPSGKTVTVAYATEDGTATAGNDYDATSGTLTFAPGITSRTITVRVTGDQLDEVDETFTVRLSNPTNASIADPLGLGTITDDDAPPTLSVDNVTVTEGNAGAVNATFTVELSAPSGKAISVGHATANGEATAPADYTSTSGPLLFAAGATTKTVTVPVQGDTLDEVNETYTLNLSGASNATILDGTGVGTITDDDAAPTLAVGDITVAEGNTGTTAATFTATLSAASGRTVTVNYATANGSALAPADYTSTPGSLSFTAGDTTETITVPVNGDLLDEIDETFAVNLSGAVGASVTDAQGVATITDDDPLPALSVGDVTVVETDTGTVEANFTVTLNAPSGRTVTVDFATANGTAVAAAGDYTPRTGALSFAPGETTKTVTVNVNGDVLDEVSETYFLRLAGPTNATIADGEGVGTIIDNDGLPSIFINDVSVVEGNSGTVNANFTVSLSAASGQAVTVGYTTADGTASAAANDYTAGGGNLSFTPGQTTRTVTVPVKGDTIDEPNETFTVDLSAPGNADIADDQGVGTIADDDAPPTLSVTDTDVAEGDAGTTVAATFTVRLNAASAKPVTVDFATADGTAAAPTDYAAATGALSFAAGETAKDVTVVVNGDAVNEPNETFALNLANATNASIVDGGLGTILNDDLLPAVSVADVAVPEGNAGTTTATFTVTINRLSSRTVTVDYATANRSAITPEDYDAVSGSLTFEPGQTSKTVPVPVRGDGANEPDESFVLNLSNVVAGSMADNQAVGTIANDDAAPPPPPAPAPPPPPPPPAPDTTAPGEITNVRVVNGDGAATVTWTNPSDADFQRVSAVRVKAGAAAQNLPRYEGRGTTFTDRGLQNGLPYRYRIRTYDGAGNVSAGIEVAALPKAALFGPPKGAKITTPPTLRWKAVRGATYYNVQLYLVRRGKAIKVLSAWPKGTSYKLSRTWRFGGKTYRLAAGNYRWYVWPGLAKRSAKKYGPMVGESSFTVKAKTTTKRRR